MAMQHESGRTQGKPKTWGGKGFVPFRLEVLTPVFIGSGDKLSPLEFVLGKGNDDSLYRVDINSWMTDHGSDRDVLGVIDGGDLRAIRRMFQERISPDSYAISRTAISHALKEKLLSKIGDRSSNSLNEVDACMRNPLTAQPYIPGSSLKGAMLTPIIDAVDQALKKSGRPTLKESVSENRNKRAYANWLRDQFGDISNHAMQALKVSDCAAGSGDASIVSAMEKSMTAGRQGTPKAPAEALLPGSELWGRLLLAEQEGQAGIMIKGAALDISQIRRLCNAFYKKRFDDEKQKFYAKPHFAQTLRALGRVEERLKLLAGPNPPLLLRVGHYSHVECVTVQDNDPFRRRSKGRLMPTGTTRTLANGVLPFGWVLLHFCGAEAYAKGVEAREASSRKELEARRTKIDEIDARRLGARAAQERLVSERLAAAEKQRKQDEEKAKSAREDQEKLAAMSEAQRMAYALNHSQDEKTSMEAFEKLNELGGEDRLLVAQALRACWQKMGKWEGKQSKKQAIKIKALKEILGA